MKELILPIALACIFTILCEGVGLFITDLFKIKTRGFSIPLGVAAIFSVLEVVYLPNLLFSITSTYAWIVTVLVMLATCIITLYEIKKLPAILRSRDTYLVLASVILYVVIFVHSSDIKIGTAELSFIAANSFSTQVSFSSNPLQGYQLFEAMLLRVLTREQLLLMLGCVYHFVFGTVVLNIIRFFRLKNWWFAFTLVVYAVFYSGFHDWQIARAASGSNWRMIFIALLLWGIYVWLTEERENDKYTLLFYMSAGMFVTGGFSVICFEIMYCLGAYLFYIGRIHSLFDLTTLLIPHFAYMCMQLLRWNIVVGVIALVVLIGFVILRRTRKIVRIFLHVEDFLMDHGQLILMYIIPITVMIVSVVLWISPLKVTVPFSFYRQFLSVQPARSYLFLDHRVITWVLDACRWGGLLVFLFHNKKPEDIQLKGMFTIMLILFVNPLSMGLIARFVGVDVYAFTFEILFNPFTDLIFLIAIYQMFEWQVFGQWVLEIFLIAAALIGHVGSFTGMSEGLYTSYMNDSNVTEVQK